MSEPTGPVPATRRFALPIVLGLLLVAAVIAVALLIERATDDDIDLPETLPGGFSAAAVDDPQRELVASAEEGLEEALEVEVTVQSYLGDDAGRQVTVTAVDEPAGPFAPSGPQAGADALGQERAASELVREGETTCELAWEAAVPEGGDVPDGDPASVHCQLAADGRTYWLNGRGLSADEAADILESVTG